jgi:hypothetical protein
MDGVVRDSGKSRQHADSFKVKARCPPSTSSYPTRKHKRVSATVSRITKPMNTGVERDAQKKRRWVAAPAVSRKGCRAKRCQKNYTGKP